MSNPNILVIGNGFDLYHGLKTNYIDFVRFSKELTKSAKGTKGRDWVLSNSFVKCFINVVSENQSWIDCEKEIEVILTMILKIMYDRNTFIPNTHFIDKNQSSLTSHEFARLKLMNKFCKRVGEQRIEFQDRYFKVYQGIDKNLIMKTLIKDLNDVIKLFKYYLEENVINQSVARKSKQIESINAGYVINFNYTNIYEYYGINKQNVCYIHGSVQDNNMVLGIRDIDEKDINSIYFKKFFQRIQKHTDVIQWARFEEYHGIASPTQYATTYFFGHSLSNNDGDIIRSIYEKSQKIIIYHLKGNKDYEQKIINLIETLGKENVIQGMYSGKIELIPIEESVILCV